MLQAGLIVRGTLSKVDSFHSPAWRAQSGGLPGVGGRVGGRVRLSAGNTGTIAWSVVDTGWDYSRQGVVPCRLV